MIKDILKIYNAENIKVAKEFYPWMRSNHAGETGAVWIYIGAGFVFWSKKIRKMALEHRETEQHHLIVMEHLLPKNEKSLLIFLWKIMGFGLGFLPSIFGYKAFCVTINAVETFVESHYNEQINCLTKSNLNPELLAILRRCCDEEVYHQQDAHKRINNQEYGLIGKFWFKIVRAGSEFAVQVAKKF